jgi:hypothetical protein
LKINNLKTLNCEKVSLNQEMEDLAESYLERNIVSRQYAGHALFIAIATVISVDVLVS